MDTRLTLTRVDTQSEVIIRFKDHDAAMNALAHNERVGVYYNTASGFYVKPMVEHVLGMGWVDARLELQLWLQRGGRFYG